MSEGDRTRTNLVDQLLTAVAEQLKMPLLQIARLAETNNATSLPDISVISEHALRLVDAYVQAQTLWQTELALEPVTTSAVLYDVAQVLQPFAEHHDVTIELDQKGTGMPVLAHRPSLKTLLTLVAASLIETSDDSSAPIKRLVLGTHRTGKGTIIGAFTANPEISQRALRLTRELHAKNLRSGSAMGMTGAAALAIADLLSEQLQAPLKSYRHRSLSGMGSLLLPSRQLQLVV